MAKHIISIGTRLRQLQSQSGMTMLEIAKAMGYRNASSLQRYLAPEYGESGALPIGFASKFAAATAGKGSPAVDAADVYDLAGVELALNGRIRANSLEGVIALGLGDHPASAREPIADIQIGNFRSLSKDLPVYGTALGSEDFCLEDGSLVAVEQTMLEVQEASDYIRRPPLLANKRDAYAVIVAGSSMSPRYEDGDTLIVDPKRQAVVGQDVVIQLKAPTGHDGADRVVAALIKRLVRRSASFVILEQFNPPIRFRVEAESIASIHRIVTIGEMFGF